MPPAERYAYGGGEEERGEVRGHVPLPFLPHLVQHPLLFLWGRWTNPMHIHAARGEICIRG